jgi:TPR repeat protein
MTLLLKSANFTRVFIASFLCFACIQPMVSLATPTQAETATFTALKAKAEAGDRKAQVDVANAYHLGEKGMIKNEALALRWYERAAKQGCVSAQRELGVLYHFSKDYKQMLYWLEKSATAKDKFSQVKLGILYQSGQGVSKDKDKALYWYQQASNQGHYYGSFLIGKMYQEEQNIKQAFYWYEKAAVQGTFLDKRFVGSLYFTEGGFLNFFKGIYWYSSYLTDLIIITVERILTGKDRYAHTYIFNILAESDC